MRHLKFKRIERGFTLIWRIKADFLNTYDFIRIKLQQVGVVHGTQINSNLLESDPPDSHRD